MFDTILRHCNLPDGRTDIDIGIANGRIAAVEPRIAAGGRGDRRRWPACLAAVRRCALPYGLHAVIRPAAREPVGTLLEGIALWGELKPLLTQDAIVERALAYCDWAVAKGLLAIRSHVDVCDPRLLATEALLHVRERVRPYLDLQLVAFPQDGCCAHRMRSTTFAARWTWASMWWAAFRISSARWPTARRR
jgi:cytosine deaminase